MCLLFAVPRVCDACKETEENDNEIVDNLCKNDFGKFAFTLRGSESQGQGLQRSRKEEV